MNRMGSAGIRSPRATLARFSTPGRGKVRQRRAEARFRGDDPLPGTSLLPGESVTATGTNRAERATKYASNRRSRLPRQPRQLRHALAVLGREPEQVRVRLRALQEEVEIVLPREADPAVHLQRRVSDVPA